MTNCNFGNYFRILIVLAQSSCHQIWTLILQIFTLKTNDDTRLKDVCTNFQKRENPLVIFLIAVCRFIYKIISLRTVRSFEACDKRFTTNLFIFFHSCKCVGFLRMYVSLESVCQKSRSQMSRPESATFFIFLLTILKICVSAIFYFCRTESAM